MSTDLALVSFDDHVVQSLPSMMPLGDLSKALDRHGSTNEDLLCFAAFQRELREIWALNAAIVGDASLSAALLAEVASIDAQIHASFAELLVGRGQMGVG